MKINLQLFAGDKTITVTIYNKDGTGNALYQGTSAGTFIVASTGLVISGFTTSEQVWTYSGNEAFLGFSTSPNQSSNPTYAVGDTIKWTETLYVVSVPITVTYKHLTTANNTKIQVDSAVRDDLGKKIDTNYARKDELDNITSTDVSLNESDGVNKVTINIRLDVSTVLSYQVTEGITWTEALVEINNSNFSISNGRILYATIPHRCLTNPNDEYDQNLADKVVEPDIIYYFDMPQPD